MLKKYLTLLFVTSLLVGGLFLYTIVEGKISQYVISQKYNYKNEPVSQFIGQRPETQKSQLRYHQVGVPILLYHGVLDQLEENDKLNITTQSFKNHMSSLKENGYTSINTTQMLDFINQQAGLPAKPVMITFDDGRKDSFVGAHPALRETGYQAVMLTVTLDQEENTPFFLNWDELNMMRDSGYWDIQAHGYYFHELIDIDQSGKQGYFGTNKQWLADSNRFETSTEYAARLAADHFQLKNSLTHNINNLKVNAFAFPFGDYGQNTQNLNQDYAIQVNQRLVQANYPISFGSNTQNTKRDFFFYPDQPSQLITRLSANNKWSGQELVDILEKFQPEKLPYTKEAFSASDLEDWSSDWGAIFTDKNSNLVVSATDKTTGGMTTLNGGNFWQNYTLKSTIDIKYGRSGFLVGHFRDNDNYIYCGIDQDSAVLMQKMHGEYKNLNTVKYPKESRRYQISLKFVDNTVKCQIDQSVTIITSMPDQTLSHGTIGFKAWDDKIGLSEVRVFDIDVY